MNDVMMKLFERYNRLFFLVIASNSTIDFINTATNYNPYFTSYTKIKIEK